MNDYDSLPVFFFKLWSFVIPCVFVYLIIIGGILYFINSNTIKLKSITPNPPVRVYQVDFISNTIIVELQDGTEFICINENEKCQPIKD